MEYGIFYSNIYEYKQGHIYCIVFTVNIYICSSKINQKEDFKRFNNYVNLSR